MGSRASVSWAAVAVWLLVGACGGSDTDAQGAAGDGSGTPSPPAADTPPGAPNPSPPAPPEPAAPDGDPPDDAPSDDFLEVGGPEPEFLAPTGDDGWQVMLTADWEIPPGEEIYVCARFTLPEDVYINGIAPIDPPGTHHTLLSIEENSTEPDGVEPCDAVTNGDAMIFASGVGTDPQIYPEGVAFHAKKGAQVVLNLHLFNASEEPVRGRSGNLVQTLEADAVEHLADNTLAGPLKLEIPTGQVQQGGRCTFQEDVTLVAVFPHMHQLGVEMTIVAHSSAMGEVTLFDGAYDFNEQRVYPLEPIPLTSGDSVEVRCTYENDTGSTVRFGDSSLAEMCFAGLTHYPPRETGVQFFCPE